MPELTPEQREALDLAGIKQIHRGLVAKPIGSVVRKLMASSGYGETQAVEQLHDAWRRAAGEQLAKLSRPANVSRGVLLVHTANSSVMQEIHFVKKKILASLQSDTNLAKITDLRIRVGSIS